jgi:hypothetical protein
MRPICLVVQVAIACWGCLSYAGTPRTATMVCGKINGVAARTLRFPKQIKWRLIDGKEARARFVAPKRLKLTVAKRGSGATRSSCRPCCRTSPTSPSPWWSTRTGAASPTAGTALFPWGFLVRPAEWSSTRANDIHPSLYTSTGKKVGQRLGEKGREEVLAMRSGYTVADASSLFDESFKREDLIECGCNMHALDISKRPSTLGTTGQRW